MSKFNVLKIVGKILNNIMTSHVFKTNMGVKIKCVLKGLQ
jgi:hypothetical protein